MYIRSVYRDAYGKFGRIDATLILLEILHLAQQNKISCAICTRIVQERAHENRVIRLHIHGDHRYEEISSTLKTKLKIGLHLEYGQRPKSQVHSLFSTPFSTPMHASYIHD